MGRIEYDPDITTYNHAVHYGGGYPYYRGDLLQSGHGLGGILRGIYRTVSPLIRPIAKKLLSTAIRHPTAKSFAKSIAKQAAETGLKVAKDVLIDRKRAKDSLRQRIAETIGDVIDPHHYDPRQPQKGGAAFKRYRTGRKRTISIAQPTKRGKKKRRYKDTIFD